MCGYITGHYANVEGFIEKSEVSTIAKIRYLNP